MPIKLVKIGVKSFLDLFYHPKDLGVSYEPVTRAQEGIAGHQLIRATRPASYQTEVPIDFKYNCADYELVISGRIDGFFVDRQTVILEEIKTTYNSLTELTPDLFPKHRAQLQLYLYFWMAAHPGKPIKGRLTYVNLTTLSERFFDLEISLEEGRCFFQSLAGQFLATQRDLDHWRQIRNHSILNLAFPFPQIRPGQNELIDTLTTALEQERDIFIEAATGIGKTIGVLYPALKAMGQSERYEKIFFFTAKTAGKEILKKTVFTAQSQGLRLRTVFIEAKERVCLSPGAHCNPRICPNASNYYDKAKQALPFLLSRELILPEELREFARNENLCPFELSLDLALWADLIVCDYNYLFDPGVYLKRFFQGSAKHNFLFLIDEAHNLVPRGRDMYSAALCLEELISFANQNPAPDIQSSAAEIESFFGLWLAELAENNNTPFLKLSNLPDLFEPALERLVAAVEYYLRRLKQGSARENVLQFYFKLTAFTRITALVNQDYAVYLKKDASHSELRLFCLNPGKFLRRQLDKGRMAVFFSATLSPFQYFRELLGGKYDALHLRLPSPFPKENRLYLHVPGIDTRYWARPNTLEQLAHCATEMVTIHPGNYLMFFPSYSYLQAVLPLLKLFLKGKALIHWQSPSMNDLQKQEFLSKISTPNHTGSNLGLAVLGGIFGEGIDLPGEALVGALIVGPGLPAVNEEQEFIRQYFEERNNQGFFFAYLVPGLIRVIQSAGRVFRSADDIGVVILVDDRLSLPEYQEHLPPDWILTGRPFSTSDYKEILIGFWKENE